MHETRQGQVSRSNRVKVAQIDWVVFGNLILVNNFIIATTVYSNFHIKAINSR